MGSAPRSQVVGRGFALVGYNRSRERTGPIAPASAEIIASKDTTAVSPACLAHRHAPPYRRGVPILTLRNGAEEELCERRNLISRSPMS